VEPRVSLLTLGESDLEKAVAFYRDGLGWPKSEVGGEEVAFFKTGGDRTLSEGIVCGRRRYRYGHSCSVRSRVSLVNCSLR
jgi:predicted enzyme related to lactoylglutathione lyase